MRLSQPIKHLIYYPPPTLCHSDKHESLLWERKHLHAPSTVIISNWRKGKLLLLMLGESSICTDGFMLFLLLALQNPQRVLFSRLVLSTDKDRQLVLLPCVLSFRLMWCNHSHWYTLRGQAVKFWMAHLPQQSLTKSKPLFCFCEEANIGEGSQVPKKTGCVALWKIDFIIPLYILLIASSVSPL